ncbi:DUF4444 domain-containing protein [Tateyamaria sp.]
MNDCGSEIYRLLGKCGFGMLLRDDDTTHLIPLTTLLETQP